jgi:hypothetical protein
MEVNLGFPGRRRQDVGGGEGEEGDRKGEWSKQV